MINKLNIRRKVVVLLLISLQFALYGCNAQKHHHKAAPCPCEKNNRR
jgi:hypothetical protein